MKVLVIGANGKVGQRIVKQLKDSNHQALAMIRDEQQKVELQAQGADTVVADLEGDISAAFSLKPDAVIFTAGSGAHTGKDKTESVDMRGAQKSIDEAKKHAVDRFLMVSALGTDQHENASDDMKPYFVAKSEADQYLVQSGLNYTILRPGMLTDEGGSGSINAAEKLSDYGNRKISRDNVALAAVETLDRQNTYQKVIEMLDGKKPVKEALEQI